MANDRGYGRCTIYEIGTHENKSFIAKDVLDGAFLVGAQVELFKFDKTNLTINASTFPSYSPPGRVFTNTNVTYYVKFLGDFT